MMNGLPGAPDLVLAENVVPLTPSFGSLKDTQEKEKSYRQHETLTGLQEPNPFFQV